LKKGLIVKFKSKTMKDWEDERKPLHFEKTSKGGLGKTLEKLMNKIYKPSARIDASLRGKDITFFTNENGEPMKLFLGRRKDNGEITGDMYTRKVKKVEDGKIKESHWDNKGKVSGREN
jgi:hypothetical protein